jgi:choline monooxygenase
MANFFVDPDIALARTLDKAFYQDRGLFWQSREKIFSRSWLWVGSDSQAQEPGDQYPVTWLEDFLDEPLLLTRDQEKELHLLSNVCTHRGNLLATEPCRRNLIRCGYHGRTFQLDGKFHSMPEFSGVREFPSPADNLASLPLYRWGHWLFSSLDPIGEPNLFFQEMRARVAWLPVNEFVPAPHLSREYLTDAHWALYCENYLEGFHIPFVHAGLNAVIDFGQYRTELYRYSSLQLGLAKPGELCFDIPAGTPDFGKRVAAYYFFVFPNLMFNFYPWGLSLNVVKPLELNRTQISFLPFIWNQSLYHSGAGSGLDRVEQEDETVVQQVQKGILSRFYQHGRYSVNREQGTHHFHRLISEFMA